LLHDHQAGNGRPLHKEISDELVLPFAAEAQAVEMKQRMDILRCAVALLWRFASVTRTLIGKRADVK